MYLAVTLISAVLLGAGFVLQQRAAEEVPRVHFLHAHLIAELLRKPRWLGGLVAMVAGELLSSWAEGHARLALVEPLLATSLLLALVLAVPLSVRRCASPRSRGHCCSAAGWACWPWLRPTAPARWRRSAPPATGGSRG